ncbi:MAG: hypothetical protein KY397_05190 [Gemmatimonadetes bacterium]|nr:hypothetical protein [Gemmatimonadota bacterium]
MADPLTRPSAGDRRRLLAAALWLAGATLLGGLDLPARGFESFRFAPFGIVAGLLGLLWVFALVVAGAVRRPPGWVGAVALAYWVAATATAFRVLLPPPGLLQVGLAVAAALGAGIVATRPDRDGAVVWTGVVAVTLAVLKFAVVPVFQGRSGLPNWGPLDLGEWSEAFRDVFVAYAPQRPAAQALHFTALACWAAALWTQWDVREVEDASG